MMSETYKTIHNIHTISVEYICEHLSFNFEKIYNFSQIKYSQDWRERLLSPGLNKISVGFHDFKIVLMICRTDKELSQALDI